MKRQEKHIKSICDDCINKKKCYDVLIPSNLRFIPKREDNTCEYFFPRPKVILRYIKEFFNL
jgi:hypothetical protein